LDRTAGQFMPGADIHCVRSMRLPVAAVVLIVEAKVQSRWFQAPGARSPAICAGWVASSAKGRWSPTAATAII
jgi:hypothetical protein